MKRENNKDKINSRHWIFWVIYIASLSSTFSTLSLINWTKITTNINLSEKNSRNKHYEIQSIQPQASCHSLSKMLSQSCHLEQAFDVKYIHITLAIIYNFTFIKMIQDNRLRLPTDTEIKACCYYEDSKLFEMNFFSYQIDR